MCLVYDGPVGGGDDASHTPSYVVFVTSGGCRAFPICMHTRVVYKVMILWLTGGTLFQCESELYQTCERRTAIMIPSLIGRKDSALQEFDRYSTSRWFRSEPVRIT